ncbi:MAG: homocitrate synthase [Peptococcaceae bacterium]|nr:homocitrate synthase [Peptococcaceae bacterium]
MVYAAGLTRDRAVEAGPEFRGAFPESFGIVDTTLRDGEQAPGVAFNWREKVVIALLLDRLGVDQIEAGTPAMGEIEQEAIRAIAGLGLGCRITTWNRLVTADVRASLACGVRDVHLSGPVSDLQIRHKLGKTRGWVLERLREVLAYAVDHGCRVTAGAEDASRADEGFLLEFALVARAGGAARLRYADTVGVLEPLTVYERISRLRTKLDDMEIEFHGHNDFGLALANAVAALKAGAGCVDTTVGGLGERAGNTSLEDLLKVTQGLYGGGKGFNTSVLPALTRFVARASRRGGTRNDFSRPGPPGGLPQCGAHFPSASCRAGE